MPLPMPGSPAASWAVYRARLKAVFDGADPRVCAAFWLFGEYCLHPHAHRYVFVMEPYHHEVIYPAFRDAVSPGGSSS